MSKRKTSFKSLNLSKGVYLAISGAISIGSTSQFAFSSNNVLAQSQIIPDNTLGAESSQVIPNNNDLPVELIDGGAKRGANLFHSFREFNVSEGRGAYFINPSGIENILSRVTGTNPSNILGILGVLGNANLFLINPNGIIFGSNARLDVRGSFVASTASSLNFADGTKFSASNPQTIPLLTVSVPVGLQFGVNPGSIRVQGEPDPSLSGALNNIGRLLSSSFERNQSFNSEVFVAEAAGEIQKVLNDLPNSGLLVRPGRTLALVGGDVILEGGILTAPGGRIELGSVADSSSVNVIPTTNGLTLGYENVSNFGNIDLSQQSFLNVSGSGSGDVQMRGDRVTFKDSSAIFATTLGNRDDGEIFIQAQQLNLNSNSNISAIALLGGKSAGVTLKTRTLTAQDAFIGSFSFGQGDTGNITVQATDLIQLIRTRANNLLPSGLFAITGGTQAGGNLTIETRQLLVRDGAQVAVSTASVGQGGTAIVKASESVEAIGESANGDFPSGIFASSFGSGAAGSLNIETQQLTVRDGASISAFTRNGLGGTVLVRASDFVRVIGITTNGEFSSDISANTLGAEAAGNVQIETGQLIVRDGGQVTAAVLGQQGTGAAGNVEIKARSIYLDNRGEITTETRSGEFGNIQLQSQILLLRRGSQITTNADEGTASGGNIDIDSQILLADPSENSDITANAIEGRGGNVNITSQGIFGIEFRENQTPLSDITASSQFGLEGTVAIDAPDVEPSRRVVNFPTQAVEAEVVQACTPSLNQTLSEFVITGRGGLPPMPSEVLNTDATDINWVALNPDVAGNPESGRIEKNTPSQNSSQIVEAQGWVVASNGKIVLTARASSVTPSLPWLPSTFCKGF